MMRIWLRALSAALATAAVVGAGQLGLAYGLGIMRWTQTFEAGNENAWNAQLTWTAWIAALAVVGGAVGGVRVLRRHHRPDGVGAWFAVSLAALVGGAVVVPLVVLPAGDAHVAISVDPALQAGINAGVGLFVGLLAALAVLCARPVGGSVLIAAIWVWAAALVSAFAQLDSADQPHSQRLGVLDLPSTTYNATQNLVLPIMAGIAVGSGVLIAAYSLWLGEHPIAVAASGLAGPALVAAAYLSAGPGISSDHSDQQRPWLGSLVAVGAGVAVSVLITVAALWRRRRATDKATSPKESTLDTGGVPPLKTEPTPPSPQQPMPVRPAPAKAAPATNVGGLAQSAVMTAARTKPATAKAAVKTSTTVQATAPAKASTKGTAKAAPSNGDKDDDYVSWVSGLGAGDEAEEATFGGGGRRAKATEGKAEKVGNEPDDPAAQIPRSRRPWSRSKRG
jgi:hypothetical protein